MKQISIKQYIKNTVDKRAKIEYDREVRRWCGSLDHLTGLILSQQKTRAAVKKEIAETLEEFIALHLKEEEGKKYEIAAPKIQRTYR